MKKLMFIFTVLLTSCDIGVPRYNNTKPYVVMEIQNYNGKDNLCYYAGYNNGHPNGNTFKFYDTVGKFNIGDTIYFSKTK